MLWVRVTSLFGQLSKRSFEYFTIELPPLLTGRPDRQIIEALGIQA